MVMIARLKATVVLFRTSYHGYLGTSVFNRSIEGEYDHLKLGSCIYFPKGINAWIGSCNIGLDPAICGGGRRPRSTVDGGRSQRSVKGRDAIDARGELAGTAPI